MITIKDIARLSGYSIGTVSRVINHHPDVSTAAREKIEQVIADNNYQPNTNAKMLKQAVSSNISVLVKGTSNTFLESILEDIQHLLRESDHGIDVMFLEETANEVETAIQVCNIRKPVGIIFLGGNLNYFRESFGGIDVPCVLVADTAAELGYANLSSFTTNDILGSREAVQYLCRKGHTQIGIVGGSSDNERGFVGTRRIEGAVSVLKENGLAFDLEKQYEPSLFSIEDGYRAMKDLIRKSPEITAVFAISDEVAIGAIRAIHDLGLRVPDDISVIGYDGIEYAKFSVPRIATIRQNTVLLAQKSVDDLLLRINYPRTAVHEELPFDVINGESVAEPRK